MNFSHRLRVRLIGLLSMALLFSQLAVAAYACPAMAGATTPGAVAMAGMPCADMTADAGANAAGADLDPAQPALCLQHCQFGTNSHTTDHAAPAFAPVTALPAVFTVPRADAACEAPGSGAEDERLRHQPPPVAHSIAHCCFRL